MTTLKPVRVDVRYGCLWVLLANGQGIRVPLIELDWLRRGSLEDQQDCLLDDSFIWWHELNCGVDTKNVMRKYGVLDKTEESTEKARRDLEAQMPYDLSLLWEENDG